MNKIQLRPALAFLGNLLDHYTSAVFSLCTPLLMPLLFPNLSTYSHLIKAFSLLPLTVISKPLGAIFFSYITQRKNPELSLKLSYCGMGLTSLSFALLSLNIEPDTLYLFLILTRLLQGFFSSGETINGAMYVLDFAKEKQKGLSAGFYDACSLAGYILASFLIYYLQKEQLFTQYWRLLFLFGILTTLPAFFLKKPSSIPITEIKIAPIKLLTALQISVISGISYAFFSLCFVFTTHATTLFQKCELTNLTKQTSNLLIIDLFLLPICGLISGKISYVSLMKSSLIAASFLVPLLFFQLKSLTIHELFFIRLTFTILGAIFSSGVFRYCKDKMPYKNQTVALSLSFSLGSSLMGQSFALISTSVYNFFPSPLIVGTFFSFLCLLGLIMLQIKDEKTAKLI